MGNNVNKQTPPKEKSVWQKFFDAINEGGRMARDARIGAVGAEPIREMYNNGQVEDAQRLAKQYLKANVAGIAAASGAAALGASPAPMTVPKFFAYTQQQALPATTRFASKYAVPFLASMVGGEAVNKGSEALTGKTFGENLYDDVSQVLPESVKNNPTVQTWGPVISEFLNPGYTFGGYAASKGLIILWMLLQIELCVQQNLQNPQQSQNILIGEGEFVDDVSTAATREWQAEKVAVAEAKRYNEWLQNPSITTYRGTTLSDSKAKAFKEDVSLLNYYGTHQTKSPDFIPIETVKGTTWRGSRGEIHKLPDKQVPIIRGEDKFDILGKYIGEGAESTVFDPNNGYVYKKFRSDWTVPDHTAKPHTFHIYSPVLYDHTTLYEPIKKVAGFRSRHPFVKKSYPAVLSTPTEGQALLIQEKVRPASEWDVIEINKQLDRLKKSSFWQEIYSTRPAPGDIKPDNLGFDSNGVLWGIDLFQSGGQFKPNFIQRLEDPNRKSILDWESKPTWRNNYTYDISTHKMGYEYTPDDTGRAIVYPEVQEINGKLVDFTRPPYHGWAGYDSALDRGDYLMMNNLEDARKWVESYKDRYKNLK